MATVGNITIGVNADTAPLNRNLAEAASTVSTFGAGLSGAASTLRGIFAAAVGGAAVTALYKFSSAAASVADATAKIDAVFGQQAGSIKKLARDMADAYGEGISGILDKQGQLGSLFSGANFSPEATAKFTEVFTKLANDLGRFNSNGPGGFAVAFEKLRAGLSGESEPLKAYGILLNEAAVEAKAFELGLAKTGEKLTETAKIQARANLILDKSGAAIGAAAREADGAAAKIDAFWGRLENLQVTIGDTFAPTVGDALGGIGVAIKVLDNAWSDSSGSAVQWADSTVGALGVAGDGVNILQVAIGRLADGWQVFMTAIRFGQGIILGAFTAIIDGAAKVAQAFDYIHESLTGVSTGIGEEAKTIADSMKASLAELRGEFLAELKKPWASEAISKQFDETRQKLGQLRKDLAKEPLVLPTDVGGKLVQDKKKQARDPFAGAQLLGSTDAASTVLRSRYGSGKNTAAEQTASNTKQLTMLTKDVVRGIRDIGPNVTMDV